MQAKARVPEETPPAPYGGGGWQGRYRRGANEGSEGSRRPKLPPKRERTFGRHLREGEAPSTAEARFSPRNPWV